MRVLVCLVLNYVRMLFEWDIFLLLLSPHTFICLYYFPIIIDKKYLQIFRLAKMRQMWHMPSSLMVLSLFVFYSTTRSLESHHRSPELFHSLVAARGNIRFYPFSQCYDLSYRQIWTRLNEVKYTYGSYHIFDYFLFFVLCGCVIRAHVAAKGKGKYHGWFSIYYLLLLLLLFPIVCFVWCVTQALVLNNFILFIYDYSPLVFILLFNTFTPLNRGTSLMSLSWESVCPRYRFSILFFLFIYFLIWSRCRAVSLRCAQRISSMKPTAHCSVCWAFSR